MEDLLLATLEYLREYRTYAHIAASYDVAGSSIYRGIRWAEDTLIKDGTFSLPGRKALIKSEAEYDALLEHTNKIRQFVPEIALIAGKNIKPAQAKKDEMTVFFLKELFP